MVTAPFPFPFHCVSPPFPSATTYPPPIVPGGHHTFPFPFPTPAYSAPPAFPYAPSPYASSSYPAPPAPGCFPAPAYGPPPPTYHYGPDPAPVFPNPYYQFYSPPPEWTSPSTTAAPVFGNTAASSPGTTATAPTHQHNHSTAAAYHATSTTGRPWIDSAPNAAAPAVADEGVPATDATLHRLQHELFNIQARLCQQQAHKQTSFTTLQGELAKLKSRVSQCAVSIGKQSSAAASSSASSLYSPVGAPSVVSTPTLASVSATSASTMSSTTAHVAQQLFGEMPRPNFGHGTPVIAPRYENYGSGYSNQMPSSYVQGRSTNLSEQNPDVMPVYDLYEEDAITSQSYVHPTVDIIEAVNEELEVKVYGFKPIICPEPLFAVYDESDGSSTESVPLFIGTPEKLTCEEDKPETEQTSKYSRKASKNEIPSQQPSMSATATDQMQFQAFESMPKFDEFAEEDNACLSIISDVHDFTLELQQQDDERSSNCPVLKTSDSYVTRSCQLSIVHSVREMRLVWDPGDTTFYALFMTADSATKLQRTNVYKPAVVQILDVQFGVRRALIFKSAVMCCDAFGLARTKVNGSALFVLVVPGSADTSCSSPSFENMAKLLWDPGIGISSYMYLWPEMRAVKMLGKTAVPNLVHSGQIPCNLRNFLGHPVDLKQIGAQLLQCHT